MPDQVWTGAYGRLRVLAPNFLTNDFLQRLVKMGDVREVVEALESTWYGEHLEAMAAVYRPPELVEVASNRLLVRINGLAMNLAPAYEKRVIAAYLSKWDVQNIELVLASKVLKKGISEVEGFLVSERNLPVGFAGQLIPFSELKSLLSEQDLTAVLNSLVKYGFGSVLLQRLGAFQKTQDLGVFSAALKGVYYSNLLWNLRYFKGDEGPIRDYIKAEITKNNLLNLVKGKLSDMDRESVRPHLLEGGFFSEQSLLEFYNSPSLEELIQRFSTVFDVSAAVEAFSHGRNLSMLEARVDRSLVERYASRLKTSPPTASFLFYFLVRLERERENLRRIVYGKHYHMSEEDISSVLLLW